MTIVHHKAIDALRARNGRTARNVPLDVMAIEKEGADVSEGVLRSLRREAVRNALSTVPEEQRKAIEMAYFEGLTHVEVAEALELPLGTVKSRLRLGLDKMRTALGVGQADDLQRS
jgi:RNA polymerase sigma-70 factor (ECF subfamily)